MIPGKYILMLEDAPVSSRFKSRAEMESSEALTYRRQIEDRQAGIKQDLAARNITVTGSVSLLINAIFVNAPASRVAELSTVSGVVAVRPMRKFRARLDQATQVMNGPAAWAALGGVSNAGAGVKIGIVDSGIDQNHPAFKDSSLSMPAGFPKYTTGHPEDVAYTTNKVIVARSYVRLLAAGSNPANNAVDDVPDDYSPRDRIGHGTSVASCAGANVTVTPGVSSSGTPITIQGMAPKAYLGNYKIAGSPGVLDFATDQTLIQSVEDAVSDGMDIISTSWGGDATSSAASDPVAMAWEAASQSAVVLVAAGNAGENGYSYPNFNSISSPSNAPDAISVGATENSHVLLPAVSVNASGAPAALIGIPAQPSDSYSYPSSNGADIAPLVDVTSLGNNGLACSALPANSLNGAYVLVERGTCSFAAKAVNAENAGAIGMIIYWADSSAVIPIVGVGFNDTSSDAEFIGPVVSISNAAGVALKSYIDANPGQLVRIDNGASEMDISAWSAQYGYSPTVVSSMLVGFSSMGPTPDGMMKPDVLAVGGNDIGYLLPDTNDQYVPSPSGIYMATQSYDPNTQSDGTVEFSANGYIADNGTSFATPLVAGAAALVKQAHASQNLRGTQIRSLLVNYTSQAVTTDDSGIPVDAQWLGAGLVNAGASVAATITAEPATVSFGFLNSAKLPITQTIKLTNIGSSAVTLTAVVSCCSVNGTAGGSLPSATVAVSPTGGMALAAGASGTLTVALSGTIPPASEYSGTINLQQGSTVVARIPFMMIEGDLVPFNLSVVAVGGEGPPSTDIGPNYIQVTDQYGVPVANSPVTFSISPRGGVSLQSVAGEPACTSSATAVTCNTDQYGFAYAEVITGATARQVTISSTVAGNPVSATVNIQAPPRITGVADAAAGLTTVAPGSYIAIYGTGMANFTDANSTVYNGNSVPNTEATDPIVANGAVLPLQIDYVTVSFDVPSAGISVPGHLTYASPTQVNVQIPWELQGQSSVQMKVTLDSDLFGNVYTLNLANAAPAFFAVSGTALGTDLSGGLLTTANAAKRGSVIVLYANGLGPVSNQPASGDPAGVPLSATKSAATVMIGGQAAAVGYAGLVPGLPGLYQLNVTVPSGIGIGAQPITVAIGGATSPGLTIPVQ